MRVKVQNTEVGETCKECGKVLTSEDVQYLHMSTDCTFFDADELPEGYESQGWFTFGSTCAKKVLKRGGKLCKAN